MSERTHGRLGSAGFRPVTYTWTPTLQQGASGNISKTVNLARYVRFGPLLWFWVQLTSTGTGTSGSVIEVTMPALEETVAGNTTIQTIGVGYYLHSGTYYSCQVQCGVTSSLSVLRLYRSDVTGASGIGNGLAIAVASGDVFHASGCMEIAP